MARLLPPWWLLLIAGVAWIVVSVILLRVDYASVYAIALLFAFVALAAGVTELGRVFIAAGWWKLLMPSWSRITAFAGSMWFVHIHILWFGSWDSKRQVIADHQWETVKEEDKQNEQLLELSNQILELTQAIHQQTSSNEQAASMPQVKTAKR